MAQAEAAHQSVSKVKFDLEDINNLKERVFMEEETGHFFSKPIKMNLVSAHRLTNRLEDSKDQSFIHYPFVFTPSRKDVFRQLLPFPKKPEIIIEGFAQSGKSIFGCHLALIYRMKPQNHAVIYVGNVGNFNRTPSNHIMEDIFYWFYEEIRDSPKIQAMLDQITHCFNNEKIFNVSSAIFREIKRICDQKGKKILFIFDQYFRKSEESDFELFFELLNTTANATIYITNNTDPITEMKQPDYSTIPVYYLNEIDNAMNESELLKLIKHLFRKQTQDFFEKVLLHTEGNLTLILLFYKHWCLNTLLEKGNFTFSKIYKIFSNQYINESLNLHRMWLEENHKKFGIKFEYLNKLMTYVDRDYPFPYFNKVLLDKTFIYVSKNQRLHSINPLISQMLTMQYREANDTERLLNIYREKLSRLSFVELFEFYLTQKIIEMNNEGNSLKISVGERQIIIYFDEEEIITHGQTKGIKFGGKNKGMIYFNVPKTNGNCFLMKPTKNNFPLIDLAFYNKSKKQLLLINYEFNSGFINSKHKKKGKDMDFGDYFVHYYQTYTEQAKNQLGNIFFFIN